MEGAPLILGQTFALLSVAVIVSELMNHVCDVRVAESSSAVMDVMGKEAHSLCAPRIGVFRSERY